VSYRYSFDTYSDTTRSQRANSDPGEGSLGGVSTADNCAGHAVGSERHRAAALGLKHTRGWSPLVLERRAARCQNHAHRHAGRDACVILATPAGDLLILIKRTAAPGTTLPRLAVASDDGQRRCPRPLRFLLITATARARASYGEIGRRGAVEQGRHDPGRHGERDQPHSLRRCTLFLRTGKSSPKSAGENSVAGRAGDRQKCMLHSSERRDA